MKTKKDIITEAVKECLTEMYKWAQPSLDYQDFYKKIIDHKIVPDEDWYMHYYLSEENFKSIRNYFMEIYHLNSEWKDYMDIAIKYLKEGGYETVYKKENGTPFRTSANTPKLIDIIPEENANKVFELLNKCKNFYKFNSDEETFLWNILNFSPTSNKEEVEKYWKDKGTPVKIKEISEAKIFGYEEEGC